MARFFRRLGLAASGLAPLAFLASKCDKHEAQSTKWPFFTKAEVAAHASVEDRVWVTYRDEVFDVTSFVDAHPGGKDFLMQAAGGAIDPWWGYWARHIRDSEGYPNAYDSLRPLKIGQLADGDIDPNENLAASFYAAEPKRDPRLAVMFPLPFNAEPPPKLLASSYITPASIFFVRNHGPVPSTAIEMAETFEVTFSSADGSIPPTTFSVKELQEKFPSVTVTSVLQCSGNRGPDMIQDTGRPTGLSKQPLKYLGTFTRVGNAQWSGVRLPEVLKQVSEKDPSQLTKYKHVIFEGADGYSTSSPLEHVLDETNDAILATQMNGESLTADHGFPLRVVLPGVIGARNVKWLTNVTLSEHESRSPWQVWFYKAHPNAPAMHGLPIQSLILDVQQPRHDRSWVGGIAYSGVTGRQIAHVQVSTDLQTWHEAELLRAEMNAAVTAPPNHSRNKKSFGWIRWQCELPVSSDSTKIFCRAVDEVGETQPQQVHHASGYLYNGWHNVRLPVSSAEQYQTKQ